MKMKKKNRKRLKSSLAVFLALLIMVGSFVGNLNKNKAYAMGYPAVLVGEQLVPWLIGTVLAGAGIEVGMNTNLGGSLANLADSAKNAIYGSLLQNASSQTADHLSQADKDLLAQIPVAQDDNSVYVPSDLAQRIEKAYQDSVTGVLETPEGATQSTDFWNKIATYSQMEVGNNLVMVGLEPEIGINNAYVVHVLVNGAELHGALSLDGSVSTETFPRVKNLPQDGANTGIDSILSYRINASGIPQFMLGDQVMADMSLPIVSDMAFGDSSQGVTHTSAPAITPTTTSIKISIPSTTFTPTVNDWTSLVKSTVTTDTTTTTVTPSVTVPMASDAVGIYAISVILGLAGASSTGSIKDGLPFNSSVLLQQRASEAFDSLSSDLKTQLLKDAVDGVITKDTANKILSVLKAQTGSLSVQISAPTLTLDGKKLSFLVGDTSTDGVYKLSTFVDGALLNAGDNLLLFGEKEGVPPWIQEQNAKKSDVLDGNIDYEPSFDPDPGNGNNNDKITGIILHVLVDGAMTGIALYSFGSLVANNATSTIPTSTQPLTATTGFWSLPLNSFNQNVVLPNGTTVNNSNLSNNVNNLLGSNSTNSSSGVTAGTPPVSNPVTTLFPWLKPLFDYFDKFLQGIKDFFQGISDFWTNWIVNTVFPFFSGLISNLFDLLNSLFSSLYDTLIKPVVDFLQGLWTDFTGWFKPVWNKLSDWLDGESGAPNPNGNNDYNFFNMISLLILLIIKMIAFILAFLGFLITLRAVPADSSDLPDGVVQGLNFVKTYTVPGFGLSFYDLILTVGTILFLIKIAGLINGRVSQVWDDGVRDYDREMKMEMTKQERWTKEYNNGKQKFFFMKNLRDNDPDPKLRRRK